MKEIIKEYNLPFNLYDFFGYWLPGIFFISILIVEYDLGDLMLFYKQNNFSFDNVNEFKEDYKLTYIMKFLTAEDSKTFRFVPFFLFSLFAYLIGHIISAFSSVFYERLFINSILKYPSENLIQKPVIKNGFFRFLNKIFAGKVFIKYCAQFSEGFRANLEELIKTRFGNDINSTNYFWLCFTDVAKYTPVGYRRVIHFLNLYSFSRNVSMSFLLYVIVRLFILGYIMGSEFNSYNYLILSLYLAVSILMFLNYLKLFRRQCVELYYHFYSLHRDDLIKSKGPQYSVSDLI